MAGVPIGRPEQVIPGSQIDIRKWVLMDFMGAERDGWLSRLLDAIAGEVDRLAAHDEGGFMSRVAHLAPVPKPDTQDKDGSEETI